MYKDIILASSFLLTLSGFALIGDPCTDVFNKSYERKFTIKQNRDQFDIFDKSSNRIGVIRDDKIYNKRWEREGLIKRGGEREHRPRSWY